jgi:hypothetical protein
VTNSQLPVGWARRGDPVPSCLFTLSSSTEELVWGDGVGGVMWGCVGQKKECQQVVGGGHEGVVVGGALDQLTVTFCRVL